MASQIMETNNYARFDLAPFNRQLGNTKALEESMKKYGFISAFPILVKRNGQGRFLILAGQHRFEVARKLGIPVKYVVTKQEIRIPDMERGTRHWNLKDYLFSYCREGKEAYLRVLEYYESTGIPLNAALSMLAGDSAGSGNHQRAFKAGTYKLGNPNHAAIVADIILHFKKLGVAWATNQYLIFAVSKAAWAEGFDAVHLKNKLSAHRQFLELQGSKQGFLEMLEAIYNRASRDKFPLAFMADKAAKERNVITKGK